MPKALVDTRSTRKALPCWERRVAAYLRTALMPHQWTCRDVRDRRCARCGRVLKGEGLIDARGVPSCDRCETEVATVIVAAWEAMEGA